MEGEDEMTASLTEDRLLLLHYLPSAQRAVTSNTQAPAHTNDTGPYVHKPNGQQGAWGHQRRELAWLTCNSGCQVAAKWKTARFTPCVLPVHGGCRVTALQSSRGQYLFNICYPFLLRGWFFFGFRRGLLGFRTRWFTFGFRLTFRGLGAAVRLAALLAALLALRLACRVRARGFFGCRVTNGRERRDYILTELSTSKTEPQPSFKAWDSLNASVRHVASDICSALLHWNRLTSGDSTFTSAECREDSTSS